MRVVACQFVILSDDLLQNVRCAVMAQTLLVFNQKLKIKN